MIGIVIVAHGRLADEFRAAMEHVVGPQPAVFTVNIQPEDTCTSRAATVQAAIAAVDQGDGVVLVTDMYGSTPSNLAIQACSRSDRFVLYGANLPMLVKLAKARHLPLREAVSIALAGGRKYIDAIGGGDRGVRSIAL